MRYFRAVHAILFGLCSATAVAAQSAPIQAGRLFIWNKLGITLLPDSVLGVLVLVIPGNRELMSFEGRFDPEKTREWIAGASAGLTGEAGYSLVVPASNSGEHRLGFQVSGREIYVAKLTDSELTLFRATLDTIAEAAHRLLAAGPVVSNDANGPVYWLHKGDSLTTFPEYFDAPPPRYPRDLVEKRISGAAWLAYTIDGIGAVEPASVRVLWASHPSFGKAAATAISQGRYSPGKYDGRQVRTGVIQLFRFSAFR